MYTKMLLDDMVSPEKKTKLIVNGFDEPICSAIPAHSPPELIIAGGTYKYVVYNKCTK